MSIYNPYIAFVYPDLELLASPQVIKRIPNRLQSISGKTVVMYAPLNFILFCGFTCCRDGTLITQRLHFAPVPHQNRHVLGWYRLLNDLKKANVRAICVFDGKERNAAKAAEVCSLHSACSDDLCWCYRL